MTGSRPPAPSTTDTGTQYSPPDWPPTDARSTLHVHNLTAKTAVPATASQPSHASTAPEPAQPAIETPAKSSPTSSEPIEPQLRITPHETLHNGSRKQHATSDGGEMDVASPSASKRARHMKGSHKLKTMPADYVDCDPKVLASIIAEMLMRLIQHNDSIPLKDGQLTRFHSRAPPGISVHDYLARLTFHATLVTPILLSMVFFIDRLSGNFPTFIINSLTVHRFLITAATVASKGLSDSFWTNQTYARVGGVSIKELALLELELLMKCDWRIIPGPEQLVEYYHGLVEQSEDWVLDGEVVDMEAEEERGRSRHARAVPRAGVSSKDASASNPESDEMDTTGGDD